MLNLHQSNIHIFFNLPDDNAETLAAFLSKSYSPCFFFNFAIKNFQFINLCHFHNESKRLFLNLKGSSASNAVSIVKKEYGSLVHFL